MSRHSRLEFRAFAQHFCSKITNLLGNNVLTFFVTDSSEFSLVIVSDKLRTSSRTLLLASLLASSNFLCKDKAIGIRSWLRSLSSESVVYHYIKYARIRVFTDPYYPVCSVWCYISVRQIIKEKVTCWKVSKLEYRMKSNQFTSIQDIKVKLIKMKKIIQFIFGHSRHLNETTQRPIEKKE